ncbi:sensor histidine kinase [Flexivirga meconopsidis]|uniref:sensor histidine kinase n=1 Tax=Flexivirga meconopsidis TaxID=2977121 RepID=UPI002240961C
MNLALPGVSRRRHIWGEVWRELLAATIGVALVVTQAAQDVRGYRDGEHWILVDGLLGLVSLVLLLFRRRWPFAVCLILAGFCFVSTTPTGASSIALISLTTHRRWKPVAVAGVAYLAGGYVYQYLFHPPEDGNSDFLASGIFGLLALGFCIATGMAIGARRLLIAGLHERLLDAESRQQLRVEQARVAERSRIAREMHDVLAHRISLVAMHSGALAYRSNLSQEELQESSAIIRDNAHAALSELREVLGVLRDPTAGDDAAPDAPQPTLADLPSLVNTAEKADGPVELDMPSDLSGLSDLVSRNAYRIVQEGLTNRRKHAPGRKIHIQLRHADDNLQLRMWNPLPQPSDDDERLPGAGLGLVGATERAVLVGGELTSGRDRAGDFVVRARLPWPGELADS